MRRQPTPGPARRETTRRDISIRGSQRSRLSSGLPLTAVLSTLALMAVGCGGSTETTTTTTTSTSTTPAVSTATATATTPATATKAPATGGLSGAWSGQYGGAYRGTFALNWQQSGSNLSGTIKLSAPASTLSIHGTLAGSAISFGTVGSLAITYSGSVSGSSMSGTYQVNGSTGGSWSANKTS